MRGRKKGLGVLLYLLIAVVALGVGYAAITAIPLVINGTATASGKQDNFVVEFDDASGKTTITSNPASIATYDDGEGHVTSASVDSTDTTKRTGKFDLYGFTTKDEYADVTFTVINRSADLKAKLCESNISISGGTASTFTVTSATLTGAATEGSDKCITLNANGGSTTIVVRTTLHATPAVDDITATDLRVQFSASPVVNS